MTLIAVICLAWIERDCILRQVAVYPNAPAGVGCAALLSPEARPGLMFCIQAAPVGGAEGMS